MIISLLFNGQNKMISKYNTEEFFIKNFNKYTSVDSSET